MTGSDDAMDDVYICYDDQLIDRALEVLEEAGIDALLRDRGSTAFPLTVGLAGQKVIAVPSHQLIQARTCLRAAMDDGVLSTDGTLLD